MIKLPQLDFDQKLKRFIISSSQFHIETIRGIPNRRKNTTGWVATSNDANLRYLNKHKASFEVSQAAQQVLDSYEKTEIQYHEWPEFEFKTCPMWHQKEALKRAFKQPHFALMMPTGTGKTKTVIDLGSLHWVVNEIEAILLITPSSLLRNWRDEFETHCAVPYDLHIFGDGNFDAWIAKNVGFPLRVLAISVEGLGISLSGFETGLYFTDKYKTHVIIDESTKIKNADAVRTKRAREVGKQCKFKTIMSGTPITKGPQDLYAQYEFLNEGLFGVNNFISFKNRYCVMGGYENRAIIGYRNMDELVEIVSECTYIVDKKEALPDLPEKTYQVRYVKMTGEQKEVYKEVSKRSKIDTGTGEVTIKNILTRMLRLATVASGFIKQDDGAVITIGMTNPKLNELCAIIDELSSEEPVVIWVTAIYEIHLIGTVLEKNYPGQVGYIYGEIDLETRQQTVRDFQAGKLRFIVGNPSTGGLGLTMTAASITIYFSNSFNYIDRIQSEDRVHRKGQSKPVTIIDLVTEGTVEEDIQLSIQNKQDVADYIRENIQKMVAV